jgi:APA family basic amino acid/polyamine antiporter
VDGLAASAAPAADAMELRFGRVGRTMIEVGIAVSTFGFLNLVILVTPRVYQAMARDGVFFRQLAVLHPRFRTPVAAIALQAVWAIGLLLTGTYGELLDYVTFADWIFFAATAATLVTYRRRRIAGDERRFRAPFYPWSVVLFVLAAGYVIAGSIASSPYNAVRGVLLLAAGVPVYALWRRRGRRAEAPG